MHMNTHCYTMVPGDASLVMVIQDRTLHTFRLFAVTVKTAKPHRFVFFYTYTKEVSQEPRKLSGTNWNFATRPPVQVILSFKVQGSP